jgi:hypothetical protein
MTKWPRKPCILQPKVSCRLNNLTVRHSAKSLMTLEKTHCQATKRPTRSVVDARYQWINGLTTFDKSHFQAAKMPDRRTVNTMGGGSQAPWLSFLIQRNNDKCFHNVHVLLDKNFTTCNE